MSEINFLWDPLSDNILQERDETGAVTAEDAVSGNILLRSNPFSPTTGRWFCIQAFGYSATLMICGHGILAVYRASLMSNCDADAEEDEARSKALEFKGCTPDEKTAIEKAFARVCKELFTKCKTDTGLEDCFDGLCSEEGDRTWEIECMKCDSPDVGGYTTIGDLWCVGKSSKCKPHRIHNKNIQFCRGAKDEIPFTGFELEEIWIHEMLHNCCLGHDDRSPQWEKDIFESCVKKCLKGDDDGKCKCREC